MENARNRLLRSSSSRTYARQGSAFERPDLVPLCRLKPALALSLLAWSLMAGAAGELLDIGTENGLLVSRFTGVSADGTVVVGWGTDTSTTGPYFGIRWTNGTVTRFTDPDGGDALAEGVSANGSVVVGGIVAPVSEEAPDRAFRWTAATGMEVLADAEDPYPSWASSTNADGSVVVGWREELDEEEAVVERAFRWTQANGMESLETLDGWTDAAAEDVSADGSVVVGGLSDPENADSAFRWTEATGMVSLGTLSDDETYSWATATSADGSVVVGRSGEFDAATEDVVERAFRWTEGSGMISLGTLAGFAESRANDVSGDGLVVVGSAAGGESPGRAFRWTEVTGMLSVEDWLRANGVAVAADVTAEATATNADGSVVVGALQTGQAFLARVFAPAPAPAPDSGPDPGIPEDPVGPSGPGSGLIVLDDLPASLAGTAVAPEVALNVADLLLHNTPGGPLARRVSPGKRCGWVSGNWGQDGHSAHEGDLGLAELGGCYRFPAVQVNLAAGHVSTDQDLAFQGSAEQEGDYVSLDLPVPIGRDIWLTLGGGYLWLESDIRRGYPNAGLPDTSAGQADTRAWAVRGRLDWENIMRMEEVSLTAYGDISYAEARRSRYAESGGGFPASFDASTETAGRLRLGVNGTRPLFRRAQLIGMLEGVYCFQDAPAGVSGELTGLMDFDLPSPSANQSWLRAELGLEYRLIGGAAYLTINATTEGPQPAAWISASLQKPF